MIISRNPPRFYSIRHRIGAPTLLLGLAALLAPLRAAPIPAPLMAPGATSNGSATVTPNVATSGDYGTWTVRFVAGPQGLHQGGGIRVQLPDAWHSGERNSANRLQATEPKAPHYIAGYASRPDVQLETSVESETKQLLVKHPKESLDGRAERYVFVVRVRLLSGQLEPGDVLSVVYGERNGGSPGMRAGAITTGPEPLLLAVDTNGDNQFQLLDKSPLPRILPGPPVEMLFNAPSFALLNQPVRMVLALVDKEANPTPGPIQIHLSAITGAAEFPSALELPPGASHLEFDVTPKAVGILRLRAAASTPSLGAVANPVEVAITAPEKQLFWGDLHSHARFSWDGVGDGEFDYARYVSRLDFYALTDHSTSPLAGNLTRGLSRGAWAEYNALVEQHNDPPRFVTLHAYECSFGKPYGHHNVYFRDQPGALVYPSQNTLPELWKLLQAGEALTIPHHSGKFPAGIDFAIHDPAFRRNFEIFSGHGLSEAYDPDHPLSFEHSDFTAPSTSLRQPAYAVDVWKRGLVLSTIASSDDHRARPGQPHYGLAAVRAPSLTRNDIFQGLYDRNTYGTTGAKIILEFKVNETPMGQTARVQAAPRLSIIAHGTDVIDTVDLLKWQAPSDKFELIQTWSPQTLDFEGGFKDEAFISGSIYYARLKQKNLIRGRTVMAWSSPIWTTPPE